MGNCLKKKYDIYSEEYSPMSYKAYDPRKYFKKEVKFYSKKYDCDVIITPKKYFSFD